MAIEIVDVPIKNGGSFHCYVNVHQRVPSIIQSSLDHDLVLEAMVTTGDPDLFRDLHLWHFMGIQRGRSSVELDDSPGSIGVDYILCYHDIPFEIILSCCFW